MQQVGIASDKHKYKPHVTLAYLRGTPPGAVVDWLTDHARFAINDAEFAMVKGALQKRINAVKRQELLGNAAKIKTRGYPETPPKSGRAIPPPRRPQRFGRRSG